MVIMALALVPRLFGHAPQLVSFWFSLTSALRVQATLSTSAPFRGIRPPGQFLRLTNWNLDNGLCHDSFCFQVVFDETTKTAKGVEYLNFDGSKRFVSVKREVILSAGAVASPQILMLSGIGPRKELHKHQVWFDLHVGLLWISSFYSRTYTSHSRGAAMTFRCSCTWSTFLRIFCSVTPRNTWKNFLFSVKLQFL